MREVSIVCDTQKVAQLFGDYFNSVQLILRYNIPVTQTSQMEYLGNCSHDTREFDSSNSDEIIKVNFIIGEQKM